MSLWSRRAPRLPVEEVQVEFLAGDGGDAELSAESVVQRAQRAHEQRAVRYNRRLARLRRRVHARHAARRARMLRPCARQPRATLRGCGPHARRWQAPSNGMTYGRMRNALGMTVGPLLQKLNIPDKWAAACRKRVMAPK